MALHAVNCQLKVLKCHRAKLSIAQRTSASVDQKLIPHTAFACNQVLIHIIHWLSIMTMIIKATREQPSVSNRSGLPGFGPEAPGRVRNRQGTRPGQLLAGCYPDRTYTRGVLAGLEPARGSTCMVPTILSQIKCLSSDRITT